LQEKTLDEQKAESSKQITDRINHESRHYKESKMAEYQQLKGHRDLKVYQLAYKLAMDIFNASKSFPKEEKYSLTDQIRRSSRSIAANIAEGFRKRQYPKMFVSKLADADGEATETQVWLDFARDCNYLSPDLHAELIQGYEDVGKMLGSMMSMPEKFMPRTLRRE
jgi:four helix bundle protein